MAVSQSELKIIVEAQDRASQQLRQISGAVQQLDRQVESLGRRQQGGGGILGGLLQGGAIGAGMAALQQAAGGLGGAFDFVRESVFGMNARLEQATATFRAFTGSAAAAQQIVAMLQREADVTPFDTEEVVRAGQALISSARGSQEALMELIRTAEVLAALRPEQGLEGAAVALREAFEGNLESIRERFGLSTTAIRQFQAQGMTALQAVRSELQRMGADSRLVQELARTFPGLTSNVVAFANAIRQRLGAGLFERAKEALTAINTLVEQYRERVLAFASQIGAFLGALAGRLAGALAAAIRPLIEMLAPGLWDELAQGAAGATKNVEAVGQAAEDAAPRVQQLQQALGFGEATQGLAAARGNLEALQTLAARTAQPMAELSRELGRIGIAAAETQIESDRIRRSYEAQLAPLERQLDLLRNSLDLQRVQAGLATNRATVERIRLERELAALQRAAGGQTDPNAEGLTLRQRLIALALQERELRLDELRLTEEQRPAIQSVEQQLQSLRRAQEDALAPSARMLEVYRERADVLNLERQRWDLLKADIQSAIDQVQSGPPARPKLEGFSDEDVAEAQADARQRGEELADRFLGSWKQWVLDRGADAWGAIVASFSAWQASGGQQQLETAGGQVAAAIVTGANAWWDAGGKDQVAALGQKMADTLGESLRKRLQESPLGAFLSGFIGGGGLGAPGQIGAALPQVAAGVQGVAQSVGQEGVTVNFGAGSITIGGVNDPGVGERLKQALESFLRGFILAEAATAPGPVRDVQGAGRTP